MAVLYVKSFKSICCQICAIQSSNSKSTSFSFIFLFFLDDFHLPLDVLPAVTETLDSKTKGEDLHKESRPFRYCEKKTMDLSDSDRPVSFSSTSSSASSRDSHCSFGSRTTLVSNSHLGLFNQDKETGAINLELVPARRFSSNKPRKTSPAEQEDPEESLEKRLSMPRKAESKGMGKNCAMSLVTEPTSPKLLYVDRVVQEILETERMYVQDLKSIVKVGVLLRMVLTVP